MKTGQPITALVISTSGAPGAYDIVRSLGQKGIRTAVASTHEHDIAFSSRFCAGKIVLPEFQIENYETIVRMLEAFSRQHTERPVLYYVSDPELSFVQHYRERLARWYRFLLPPDEVFAQVMNKASFVPFARRHEIPAPETYCVASVEELRTVLLEIPLPCIVKPAFSEDWIWDTEEQKKKFGPYKKALRRFMTREEVLEFCRDLPVRAAGYLVQSYIDGRDETIVSFHGYFDAMSNCLGYFLGRKIRTYPPHTGGSVYVETFRNLDLEWQSIASLQKINFQGIVKIDYKWDSRAKEYKLLEINPRYNLWELLGAYAGVNLAWIAYQNQRGQPVNARQLSACEARLLYLKQDLRAFFDGYRTSAEWSVGSYIHSLNKKKYYRVFDPSDPIPFAVSLLQFVTRNISRLVVPNYAWRALGRLFHFKQHGRVKLDILPSAKHSPEGV